MNKLFPPFFKAIVVGLLLTGCSKESDVAPSNQLQIHKDSPAINVVVGEISLAGFTKISNDADYDIEVVSSTESKMVIEADTYADLAAVTGTVTNSELTVTKSTKSTGSAGIRKIYIYTPAVSQLAIERQGNVTTQGYFNQLDVIIRGSGRAQISGAANTLRVIQVGLGSVDALSMPAQNVVVDARGAGSVKVHAQSSLDVDLKGPVTVYYMGSPSITQSIRGGGRVVRL